VASIIAAKQALREQLRRDRELSYMPESWLHIVQSREIQSANVVASYHSYGIEPQTFDINQALLRAGKTLLLPRTLKDRDIEWVAWDGAEKSLKKRGKVLEPLGSVFENEALIDVLIIPALHIDREGNRLGQGGGSYDRALARSRAWKVGLVGATELSGIHLPVEEHDQKVDAAATPTLLLRFTRSAAGHP
jgi:5-formyltetrahydrofolate cyclo-ligase